MRGLTWNRINTVSFIYENDQHKKHNSFDNFEITTPTHMGTTHAISKIEQKSQNRIPRELDQKFGTPRIGTIHWVSSTIFKYKNRSLKKVMSISYPGIQPNHTENKNLTLNQTTIWHIISNWPFTKTHLSVIYVTNDQSILFWLTRSKYHFTEWNEICYDFFFYKLFIRSFQWDNLPTHDEKWLSIVKNFISQYGQLGIYFNCCHRKI